MKKRKSFAKISLVLGLCLILVFSAVAYLFNSNAGKLDVREIYYETQFGTLSGTVYKPVAATATAQAPAIVLAHSYNETRETMDMPAIELSRRGYVVFAIDLYGHGHSTLKTSLKDNDALNLIELNAAGLWDAVAYLGNCKYVNQSKIAVVAQSIPEFNTASKVLEYDNAQIDAGGTRRIAAVMFVGSEPAEYGYIALRNRDVGILTGTNNEYVSHKNYLASTAAHKFVNDILAAESQVASSVDVVNGLSNLRTPGYSASFLSKTSEYTTGGQTIGEVLSVPAGWAAEIATTVSANPDTAAFYTWTRISATGARTAINGATGSSYTLVAADIAVDVKVEVMLNVTYSGNPFRAVYLSNSTYSRLSNSFSGAKAYINFFGMATQVRPSAYLSGAANSEIAQTWWIEDVANAAALVGFFLFVVGVVLCLMKLKFFRALNNKAVIAEVELAESDSGNVVSDITKTEGAVELDTKKADEVVFDDEIVILDKPQSKVQKIVYWASFALVVVLGGILFYALMYGVGGGAVAVNYVGAFPQPVSNALLVWTVIMAVIIIGVFALSMVLNKVLNKDSSVSHPSFKESFRGWGIAARVSTILKALLVVVVAVLAGYILVFFCQWMWQVDFRLGLIAVKTFNKDLIGVFVRYIPFFFVFYFAQSFVINNSLSVKRREIWNYLLAIAMTAGGLVVFGIIYYLCILGSVAPLGQAMIPALSIALIPLLAVSAVLSRLFYKKTGKIWLGAFLNTLLLTVILCANTVTLL